MRRLLGLGLGLGMLGALWLVPAQAGASTLAECLAEQHVCVAGSARSLVSQSQEAQLEQQIGGGGNRLGGGPPPPSGPHHPKSKKNHHPGRGRRSTAPAPR